MFSLFVFFLFYSLNVMIYMCDIGILLKSSLGEFHRHVCHVLLRILYSISSTFMCPFVCVDVNQFYKVPLSFGTGIIFY